MDQDTFVLESGNPNFENTRHYKCCATERLQGWSQIDGNQNRYFINDMLSGSFSVVRNNNYHSGLDLDGFKGAKEKN
jgi:hypothetical protein